MKNPTMTGRILAYTGIFTFAFAFNRNLDIIDTPEPYSSLSIH
ncbi:hypothetical protein J2Z69_001016 [Paenibacillus shirakamiensis]|uniref:Uncharacterized protein n=1 Tax=Paenibacillus shirakamiensis TaxID=1265935 RepID=A0ABS4JE49_9BACL|nr:hypothetical protein [Paenibacillus shirakamiensis]